MGKRISVSGNRGSRWALALSIAMLFVLSLSSPALANEEDVGGRFVVTDFIPPIISDVSASPVGTSWATITWVTDKPSTTQVEYGTTTGYGSKTTLVTSLTTGHSVTIRGLLSSTTYHYRVYSTDIGGDTAISDDYTFRTLSAGGGGGGGGAPPAPPPPPGATDVSEFIDINGVFQHSISATPADGMWILTIDAGTIGLTNEGDPLSEIMMVPMKDPPELPEYCSVIGWILDLGPGGATIYPFATLTANYDPGEIPDNVNETNLVIVFWDAGTGKWVQFEDCVIDPTVHTTSSLIRNFGDFALLVCAYPANFTATNLSITPGKVSAGEDVTITVLVTNLGNLTGSCEVTLEIDGEKVATKEVILAGGASQEVTFTIAKEMAGTYLVDVNGLLGSFVVEGAVPEPTPAPTPIPVIFNWPLLWWIIGGFVVVGLVIFFLVRRRAA